jgi:Virulence-associated protein E
MSDPPAPSPLDAAITITVFPDVFAKAKDPCHVALKVFSEHLRNARASDKYQLKLFSPGSYGRKRTAKNALRHDNNIIELFAVVGDYDGGKVSVDQAVVALEAAGVCALALTTPSHTPDAPRWRVICPLSDPLNRARANATGFELADYHKLVSRLAGVFPDGLAPESWNRSQGWFIGTVDGAPDHQVRHVSGVCLDLLPGLDTHARPRPSPPVKPRAPRGISRRRAEPIPVPGVDSANGAGASLASQTEIPDDVLALNVQAALAAISDGEDSHQALVSLAGKFASQGIPEVTAIDILLAAADRRAEAGRDPGWHQMRASIPRTVTWAYEREAETTAPIPVLAIVPVPQPGGNGATPPPPPPPGAPPPGTSGTGPGGPQPGPSSGPSARLWLSNKNPKVAGNVANVKTALLTRPELVGCAAFDQMALSVSLRRALPGTPGLVAPRLWTDDDTSHLQDYLQHDCGMTRVSKETVQQGVEHVAQTHAFHPVRDYLDGLTWDSTKRIDTWLTDYLSVEASDYARATGRMWLIGMVARIQRPGCKLDYMPVFEGLQGTFKSEVCNALCGPWVSDQALDIRNDPRAASQHLRNVWLAEISELTLFKRPEGIEQLKAFLTRRQEKYLSRYARNEVVEPRQCGFAGTTNQSTYLHDPTGNRRIWPYATRTIYVRSLMRDRDQLWAEAVAAYRAHERYWPTPKFEAKYILPQQRARYYADAWLESIEAELTRLQKAAKAGGNGPARTTLMRVWQAAMTEPGMMASTDATPTRFDRTAQTRVREALRFLGWEISKKSHGSYWWEEPS